MRPHDDEHHGGEPWRFAAGAPITRRKGMSKHLSQYMLCGMRVGIPLFHKKVETVLCSVTLSTHRPAQLVRPEPDEMDASSPVAIMASTNSPSQNLHHARHEIPLQCDCSTMAQQPT
eukprot:TRINITY_DN36020_c0_g1_i1.p2 TRINITY_DN36020_c0_g1~~TRINITY_DN36020_c0_g1_i1.p2  ORF type:complete len:117 (+),score=1.81 TRINITY_DN36020_c0_g1_i1:298-648(+)